MQNLKEYYQRYPLQSILWMALAIRLLAAFFSKGYGFHDDHFDVIRVAQNWLYGLPHWLESPLPPKHSMPYAAVNAGFMWVAQALGLHDPIHKTTFLRIIHAFYSLLTIYYAYRITEQISTVKSAIKVGWVLCVLWFMPFMSVRFMAEMVCIPPILAGFYFILKSGADTRNSLKNALIAGVLFGISFTFRMHVVLFAGALGIVLLFEKRWKESLFIILGFVFCITLTIGLPDYWYFEYPFQYIVYYFTYNGANAYNYITSSPFKFLLTTFGFLVPPVSLMLMMGYIKSRKIAPHLFWAVLLFFIVHSTFPNKQERFILPMFPFLIIMGVAGWSYFRESSSFWQRKQRLERGCWNFFWWANVIAALALALTYSKKDRVAPIHYLSGKPELTSLIVESGTNKLKQVPVYYLGRMAADYNDFEKGDVLGMNDFKVNKRHLKDSFPFVFTLRADQEVSELRDQMQSVNKVPNYVIFKGRENLEGRMAKVNELFPSQKLILEREIEPSLFDKLLRVLNPRRHRDKVALIYRLIDEKH
ncbi:mannosyltransferase [Fulvivirga sp. M361]|uniref:glycosyltransferase family 39 protein n=1 Tax=Fulvivirga sp. M361 TaxID=2594266 RepID=UPI00117A1740|nr:glycosyltransferase family 39 protein [Fulvivirga sp. M361]TRX52433.1 mannosyltransferase [Fulvivirga sp. M361]